jgi:hypothetical protein
MRKPRDFDSALRALTDKCDTKGGSASDSGQTSA